MPFMLSQMHRVIQTPEPDRNAKIGIQSLIQIQARFESMSVYDDEFNEMVEMFKALSLDDKPRTSPRTRAEAPATANANEHARAGEAAKKFNLGTAGSEAGSSHASKPMGARKASSISVVVV